MAGHEYAKIVIIEAVVLSVSQQNELAPEAVEKMQNSFSFLLTKNNKVW